MKTQVTVNIFKWSPIHDSMIYQFPELAEFTEILFSLATNQMLRAYI